MKSVRWITITLLLFASFLQGKTYAQITLGQSCAISGPAAFLGTEMNRGAKAYFDTHAPEIILKTMDDRYEPEKCIRNTNTFITGNVTALFGYVGTPTSNVAVPISREKRLVFFGAFTGADFISDYKTNPYSFSVRASYDAEIENMVKHLKQNLNITRFSLFVQRDSFGLAGARAAVKAVKKMGGIKIVPPVPDIPDDSAPRNVWDQFWKAIPNYQRNTVAVGRSARMVMGIRPQAVILVGAYRACSSTISLWKRLGFDAVFVNISFAGGKAMAEACKNDLRNVLISQVVPNPWDAGIPIVREYQKAVGVGNYGFVSLEGYIAAKILHKAIRSAGASVNSETLRTALESMKNYDIGGLNVSFGPDDHRGLDAVYLTRVEAVPGAGGKIEYKFEYVDKIIRE